MNIVMCSSEVFPFAKTGGLADVCGSLPIALERIDAKVSIFMPKYSFLNAAGHEIKNVLEGVYHTAIGKDIDVYFIENDEFFKRENIYGDYTGDYDDNFDRFHFYVNFYWNR